MRRSFRRLSRSRRWNTSSSSRNRFVGRASAPPISGCSCPPDPKAASPRRSSRCSSTSRTASAAEREKERLNAQLLHTHKLESLGVLAGGIAHDFNNLLMGVMGNASIVSNKLEQSSPLLKHVHAIEKAARRAADVAQQMLAYAGKGRVERRLVDLSALVSESSDLLRLSVAGRVELICELAPQLPAVEADVTQLQQVILNLVTNACEAMEGKSGCVFLRTGTVEVERRLPAPVFPRVRCHSGSLCVPGSGRLWSWHRRGHADENLRPFLQHQVRRTRPRPGGCTRDRTRPHGRHPCEIGARPRNLLSHAVSGQVGRFGLARRRSTAAPGPCLAVAWSWSSTTKSWCVRPPAECWRNSVARC